MRWLCIEVHYLAGRYNGRTDEGRMAEWPPSPHRLFQALVAAAHLGFRRTEWSEAKAAAFRWLERREPPVIIAARGRSASGFRIYVPNNDMDKVAGAWARGAEPEKQPSQLRTGKDLRPRILDGDQTVRFLWPVDEDEWETANQHAEVICREARHLHSLGLGIDLVAGQGRILSDVEKRSLTGEVFIADAGGIGSRALVAGSFDELVERHTAQTQRVQAARGRGAVRWVAPPAPPAMIREVAYVARSFTRHRPVHAFFLVDENGAYRSFDPRQAIVVAAQLRHAAHEIAKHLALDEDFIERFVCGHGADAETKNDRFSYLPLPTIGAHSDGRIRRLLVAQPFGTSKGTAMAVIRRLAATSLVGEDTGEITADLRMIDIPEKDAVLPRYLRKSRRWGSVTPMVLPGRDDRRTRKAHGLVLKALAQAGYAASVAEIHLQDEPVWPGAEMAARYKVPAYLTPFPRAHAIVTFAEEVSGPVALGGGRHSGLGIFASLGGS